MKCEKCGSEMIIDEWSGWIWYCVVCDQYGPPATDDEIEENEKSGF